MALFPVKKTIAIRYRHTDTGLTPVFTQLKKLDVPGGTDLLGKDYQGNTVTFTEVGSGVYTFDFWFTASNNPDVVFEADGGITVSPNEVRYLVGGISVQNLYSVLDAASIIWNEARSSHYSVGTFGETMRLIQIIMKGHVKVDGAAHQMVVYQEDGVTELFRSNLFAIDGSPADVNASERQPGSP